MTRRAQLAFALAWCVLGCENGSPSEPKGATVATAAPERAPSTKGPSLLVALDDSAYHAKLFADERGFHLLSGARAHYLVPGLPHQSVALPGADATWSKAGVAVWADGKVQLLSSEGGERRRVFSLREQPRMLAASHDAVVWLARAADGSAAVQTEGRDLYRSRGSLETLTLLSDWTFFVERLDREGWRIGGVQNSGGKPRFTATRDGRPPASLVASEEALFYYDGSSLEVRRLSPDLQQETVLARGGVCSPLAVAGSVFCARVEGVFEVAEEQPVRAVTPNGVRGAITALAATAHHVAWVTDAGDDRLEVYAVDRK